MYYYQHHIGDYRKDTAHLTLLEHGIYRQLLDLYYTNETPLPADHAPTMRLLCVRNADESNAYKNLINDFFIEMEDGFHHKRCDVEIAKFHGKSEKSRDAANKRWSNNADAMPTQCEGNANQEPITNNQEPITNINKPQQAASAKAQKFDAIAFFEPHLVSPQVLNDWLRIRKGKRLVSTETAFNGFIAEVHKTGMCVADAIQLCCVRGWGGLDAEWLKPKSQASPVAGYQTPNEKAKAWADKLTGNKHHEQRTPNFIDINTIEAGEPAS
jgi:uncharacterized protein YdaU (DUF1376 family)